MTLLKQQAEMLSKITKGRVKGVVKESAEAGTIYVSLYVGVPALGDYQFKLFTAAHPFNVDPTAPFPIRIEDTLGNLRDEILSTDQFKVFLKNFLSSPEVRDSIGNLMRIGAERVTS